MEFLMGRAMHNALLDARLQQDCAAGRLHRRWRLCWREADAALGNGGLGRLAACFLDSFADAGPAVVRLRAALPVRHVRPGHRGRPQIEIPGRLAAPRQPWEAEARSCAIRWASAASCMPTPARPAPALAAGRGGDGAGLRLHRARPRHRARGDLAPVEGEPASRSTSRPSAAATRSRPSPLVAADA
jgi:hypothetical protein